MQGENELGLKQCTIVLTQDCNLRCDFCFEKEARYNPEDQVEYGALKRLVDLCAEAGVKYVFLTGGEPLTYPHLEDVLQYIADNHPSIPPTIATNGVLLSDVGFCRRLICSGLKYVDVSMKGADAESWEKATGYDGFSEQMEAIRNLSSMPIEFTCSMVVTEQSVASVCDAVEAARANGAGQFSFTFFIDNVESEAKGQEYLERHNPFSLIDTFVAQVDRLNAMTDEWWVEYSFPLCVYTDEQLKLLEGRLAGPCQVHLNNAITANTRMELLPCDMYLGASLGRFGEDFASARELRELMRSSRFQCAMEGIRAWPSPKCRPCEHLELCYGGCPVLWKNYSFETLMEFKSSVPRRCAAC